jgi:molybdenum cofactor biosynthesis enzyme
MNTQSPSTQWTGTHGDVTEKESTLRLAWPRGHVTHAARDAGLIEGGGRPKGEVFATPRIAGIRRPATRGTDPLATLWR